MYGDHQASATPQITAVICALNEEGTIGKVLGRIPPEVDEVLVVDGRSSDRTVEVTRRTRPDACIVAQPGQGKGNALTFGIQLATGDIVVTLDADGATDPQEIPKFLEPLFHGYDYAKGSRFAVRRPRDMPFHRVFGNWVIVSFFNILFRRRFTDLCSGFNAFWKDCVAGIDLGSQDGFEDEPMINCRVAAAGLRVCEVGYTDQGRAGGTSKSPSVRQGFKAVKTIIREWARRCRAEP